MTRGSVLLAADIPFPPGPEDVDFGTFWEPLGLFATKITALVVLAVVIIMAFFLVAYRKPRLVPGRGQWLAESTYDVVRNGVVRDVVGPEGMRLAPYLTVLFCFILVTNLFSIVPFIQISPNSHIAFPAILAIISWVMFNYLGIRKHGFWRYLKLNLIPAGVPWFILWLFIPIEFVSTFIVRPVTLSIRLFANMFAGHLILLVFIGGGVTLLNASLFLKVISPVSFLMAIVMTFFEFGVALIQAYVFVMLSASYVSGALAEEH